MIEKKINNTVKSTFDLVLCILSTRQHRVFSKPCNNIKYSIPICCNFCLIDSVVCCLIFLIQTTLHRFLENSFRNTVSYILANMRACLPVSV